MITTLRAHAEAQEPCDEIYHWSLHRTDIEVDLLPQRGRELPAVEVKSTDRCHTGLSKGLRAPDALPWLVRRVLVYTGRRAFRSPDGIEVRPACRFSSMAASGELWSSGPAG